MLFLPADTGKRMQSDSDVVSSISDVGEPCCPTGDRQNTRHFLSGVNHLDAERSSSFPVRRCETAAYCSQMQRFVHYGGIETFNQRTGCLTVLLHLVATAVAIVAHYIL